ncbi:Restriction endonuclease [Elusimicrobium minutum Pei191]|uniref:Restriction endonuclease n=1 Tax=Elusimicrobium minutum (strain Pei191) TaxID=445932 RepID=B2KB29_ELUMP|nr:DEAD/DEAH box helicase family protein [Elusimicrobium minutum]ACC97788.1 Restriction endonuclease [Elusimicrobium minutum Pei191]
MKLHFDAKQPYQQDAMRAIIDVFKGQPINNGDFEASFGGVDGLALSIMGVKNNIVLSEEQILKNVCEVQEKNGLDIATKLEGLNFTIEMETGTGKTYVYLRTIYELNKQYGFKKFVIVVPSIAIKEGVLKNLEITHEHFQGLYENTSVKFQVYDSAKVSALRGFADSNNIEILVINIDSFAKDENVVNNENDKLTGKKPIEFIQATNPIVIVDEPQNMETEIRKRAIARLNPACTLRYSATHKNMYNLLYSLDPVKAYDLGLVKQIEVDSVITENDHNRAFIELVEFKQNKNSVLAKVKIECESPSGVKSKVVTIGADEKYDLYQLSGQREIYKDNFVPISLDAGEGFVEFGNGLRVSLGQSNSQVKDDIMKTQIERTIAEHLAKEKQLRPQGIKVLSLFFIDRVANYRAWDESGNIVEGKIHKWFEEIYKNIVSKSGNSNIMSQDIKEIHNGYFSQDKKGHLKDSSESRETKDDADTYQLIMKDKERLLDVNNPLRFIFSHSALREGWDNPNVFQICTLNETRSEMKKRQEIGRGLRLAVNADGMRIYDKSINKLTVVANETYADFSANLQKEIEDDCGVAFQGRIKDKRARKKVGLKKGFELDAKFIELWDKIKHKTTYKVDYDSQDLIKAAGKALRDLETEIKAPIIRTVKTGVNITSEGVFGTVKGSTTKAMAAGFEIPNIIDYIQSRLSSKLTRKTILEIIKASGRMEDVLKNPQMFLDLAIGKINNVMNELMVDGIKYEKIAGQEWQMLLFKEQEIESYIENLYPIKNQDKTIADSIVIDSLSSPERQFAEDCENNDNVDFFIKLPDWFKIRTPMGTYNPDWALIYKNDKRIYFVAETKSTLSLDRLRTEEQLKIKCGKAHFKDFKDVEFKHVTKVGDLIS